MFDPQNIYYRRTKSSKKGQIIQKKITSDIGQCITQQELVYWGKILIKNKQFISEFFQNNIDIINYNYIDTIGITTSINVADVAYGFTIYDRFFENIFYPYTDPLNNKQQLRSLKTNLKRIVDEITRRGKNAELIVTITLTSTNGQLYSRFYTSENQQVISVEHQYPTIPSSERSDFVEQQFQFAIGPSQVYLNYFSFIILYTKPYSGTSNDFSARITYETYDVTESQKTLLTHSATKDKTWQLTFPKDYLLYLLDQNSMPQDITDYTVYAFNNLNNNQTQYITVLNNNYTFSISLLAINYK